MYRLCLLLYDFIYSALKKYYLAKYSAHSLEGISYMSALKIDEEKKINSLVYSIPIPFQVSFKRINSNIAQYGCYFLSICFLAEVYKETKLKVDKFADIHEINLIFKGISLSSNSLKENLYVGDPNQILKLLGVYCDLSFMGTYDASYIEHEDEFAISMYELAGMTHFVLCLSGKLVWDSLINSEAFKKGKLKSKRIFVLKNKSLLNEFKLQLKMYSEQFAVLKENI